MKTRPLKDQGRDPASQNGEKHYSFDMSKQCPICLASRSIPGYQQTAASKRCFQYIQNYKNFSNLIRPWYQQASWALIGQFACCACEKVDFHCRTVFFLCVRT